MAFLAKQQGLKQWAELVSGTEVHSLNQIQNTQFTSQLLIKLDPQYFRPIIGEHSESMTLASLFAQITKYYSRQIGTNIQNIMSENINIYSSSSIEEFWELVLGIAIKGKNREKNINTILRMRTQTQQQLMRIISKLINKLGENVSAIQNSSSQIINQTNNSASNDTGIILELSEENQQLREKIEELMAQVTVLTEKGNTLKTQIQARDRERREIINIMVKEPISSKSGFIYSPGNSDSMVEFVKDLIAQVNYLTKQLNKKQQKQIFYEDVNKDLKIAYTTIFMQLEDMKNANTETHVDIKEVQKEIQQLRTENLQYSERQKELLTKISELEEQKFYLKGVVQRLEAKNSISQQKIDKILAVNKAVSPSYLIPETISKHEDSNQLSIKNSQLIQSTQIVVVDKDRQKTVRNEIDQLKIPTQRNRLQKEVSHLQKKLASVQQQNNSLKKINSILERVINDFTKESEQIIARYTSQIQPIFQQLSKTVEEQQLKRKNLQQQSNEQQIENQKKIQQLLLKIKEKIDSFDSKEVEYQKLIKKLQIQKNQLEKSMKMLSAQRHAPQQKNSKSLFTAQVNETITPPQSTAINQVKQFEFKIPDLPQIEINTVNLKKDSQIEKAATIQMPQIKIHNLVQSKIEQKQPDQSLLNVGVKNTNIAASILMQQEEEETTCRRRQYSFMGNKQSMQFGNDGELNFKQKIPVLNKKNTFGSFIFEQVEHAEDPVSQNLIESLSHVEIVDITQIQEELTKIKDHYINLTSQSQKMCEDLIKKTVESEAVPPKESSLPNMIKNYESLAQKNEHQQKLQPFIKKFQSQGLQKAQLTTENIKMKQEITALRSQIIHLNRQRKSVEERLNYLHQQSSKSQSQRTKQELNKLGGAIQQIKSIMAQTQNSYIEVQQYFCNSIRDGDKRVGALSMQVEELKVQLKQREELIAQLQLEGNLLMGAVLEFRNNWARSC